MEIENIIQQAFDEMVVEINSTVSDTIQPQRYHETSSIAEINTVYQFVKKIDFKYENSTVYIEYPCDSGRVDAVVIIENNILLVEAKCEMTNKKYKELNAQISRFENRTTENNIEFNEQWLSKYNDNSLVESLKQKIPTFIKEKWDIENNIINMYGIILSDSTKQLQVDRWGNSQYYKSEELTLLNSYNYFKTIPNKIIPNWWHLGAYKKLGEL